MLLSASKQTRMQNLFAVLILIHSSVELCLSVNSNLKYSSVMCQGKNSRWKCSGKMTDNVLSFWIKYSEWPFYAAFDSRSIKILSAPCSGAWDTITDHHSQCQLHLQEGTSTDWVSFSLLYLLYHTLGINDNKDCMEKGRANIHCYKIQHLLGVYIYVMDQYYVRTEIVFWV